MIVDCYLIFTLLSTCACDLQLHIPNFIPIKPPRRSYFGCVFSDGTRLIYLNPRLSYIITSGFRKQTTAILEFYFRFTI